MLNSTLSSWNPLSQLVPRSALIATLSVIGLVSGWVPSLSRDLSTFVFDTATYAQSTAQVTNYAKAVLNIEPVRKAHFEQVKRQMGGTVPGNICRQSSSPSSVKAICNEFYRRSAEIIKNSGLSIGEFNQITRQVQTDQEVKARVQQELVRQQQ